MSRLLVYKLSKRGAKLHFCYESGPTGYGLYRQIVELGHDSVVVAPSLVPKRAGDRQISATGTPSSPCFTMNAFWASENCDAFIAFRSFPSEEETPENSSQNWSSLKGSDQWEVGDGRRFVAAPMEELCSRRRSRRGS